MLNLRVNYPSIPQEMPVFENYVSQFSDADRQRLLKTPASFYVDESNARTLIDWLKADYNEVNRVSRIAALPSANSALFCVLSQYEGPREVAIETTTFPGFRMCAQHFGYQQIPVACDEEGMLPEALREYLQSGQGRLIYLQPTVHNPTCFVMPLARRQQLAAVVRAFPGVYILEDDAYRFLHDNPPPSFLSLMPERTIHVYSLSKPFNPFLKSAYIVHPRDILGGMENIIRLTTSSGCSLFQDFGQYLMTSGELARLTMEKQSTAKAWYKRIEELFAGLQYRFFPGSFHIWLSLGDISCYPFTAYLRTKGIDVMDGTDFSPTGDPHWVRIALGSEWHSPELAPALELIADTIRRGKVE